MSTTPVVQPSSTYTIAEAAAGLDFSAAPSLPVAVAITGGGTIDFVDGQGGVTAGAILDVGRPYPWTIKSVTGCTGSGQVQFFFDLSALFKSGGMAGAPVYAVSSTLDLGAMVASDGSVAFTSLPRSARWVLSTYYAGFTDGATVIAASGGGAWVRDLSFGSPGANAVSEWYIDQDPSGNGSDVNSGTTEGEPLYSVEELCIRLAGQDIDGSFVGTPLVFLMSDIAPLAQSWNIEFSMVNAGGIGFVGTRDVLGTHTIASATAWDDATGVIGSYGLTGAPDLTALGYVGKLARISASANPARIGYKSTIAKDLGSGVFRGLFGDQVTYDAVEPAVGDTIQIYSPSKLLQFTGAPIQITGKGNGTITFQDVEAGIPGEDHSVLVLGGSVQFLGSIVHGLDFAVGARTCTVALSRVVELRSYGDVQTYASVCENVGGTSFSARGGGILRVQSRTLIQGGGLSAGHVDEGPGTIIAAAPLVCADYGTAALVLPGSRILAYDYLYACDATGAEEGWLVSNGGLLAYASGKLPEFFETLPAGTGYTLGGSDVASGTLPQVSAEGAAFVTNQ